MWMSSHGADDMDKKHLCVSTREHEKKVTCEPGI